MWQQSTAQSNTDIGVEVSSRKTGSSFYSSEFFLPGLALSAWGLLTLWNTTYFAPLLNHGDWTKAGLMAGICTIDAELGTVVSLSLSTLSWMIMIFAMMLPANVQILKADQSAGGNLGSEQLLLLAGYSLPWLFYGIVAHSFGYLLQEIVSLSIWWSVNGWLTGAMIFAVAGLYQFSPAKRLLKIRCCDPMAIKPHGSHLLVAQSGMRQGFQIGTNCVIHCGGLMLLMFVFFPGSLLAMFVLTCLTVLDRQRIYGISMHGPIGFLLLSISGFILSHGILSNISVVTHSWIVGF